MDEGLEESVQRGRHAFLVVRVNRDGDSPLAGRKHPKLRGALRHGGVHVAVRAVHARWRGGREDVLLELEALQDRTPPPAATSEQAGEEEGVEVLGELLKGGYFGICLVLVKAEQEQEVVSCFSLRWEEGRALEVGPGRLYEGLRKVGEHLQALAG